jgi:hypothetical protein
MEAIGGTLAKQRWRGVDVVGMSRTCVKIGIIGIACMGLIIGCATKSADINGDGFPDTVQLRSLDVEPGIYVVLSEGKNPDGSIKYVKPKRIVSSNIISDIKLFDYNSDGNQDIIYRTALAGSPSNYVLLGNGDGTFKEPLELGKEFDFFKARDGGG